MPARKVCSHPYSVSFCTSSKARYNKERVEGFYTLLFSKFNRTSRQNSTIQGFRYPSPFPYWTGPEVRAGFLQSESNMQRSYGRSRSVWKWRVVSCKFALLRAVWWYTISCIKLGGFLHKWLLYWSNNVPGSSRTEHKPRGPVQVPSQTQQEPPRKSTITSTSSSSCRITSV